MPERWWGRASLVATDITVACGEEQITHYLRVYRDGTLVLLNHAAPEQEWILATLGHELGPGCLALWSLYQTDRPAFWRARRG
jgi:hypothetical protein